MLTLRGSSVGFWERHAPAGQRPVPDAFHDADPVLRSWHRAAALGVRPDGNAPPEGVDRHALLTLRARLDEVCTLGARFLDPLEPELARKNLIAVLTDAEGTILLSRGGGAFAKTAARTRLVEGAHWGERVRGTNAIGTALAERCPVSVVGAAHYERVNHGLFCCAVPIWGPEGDVVALIDVTGHLADEDPFAELAVTSFAYRLEHALRVHAHARRDSTAEARPASIPSPRLDAEPETDAFAAIFGVDEGLRRSLSLARKVAPSDLPVLLLAETGTGKELLARALHAASDRKERPFVPINCGAIAPTLLESELFGFAAGAFTGARSGGYVGKVGAAKGGTLFLDEVAEMPGALQAAVLRVLDEGTYYPVGDNRPQKADIRLVCATCRDLAAMVQAGTFRSDLYYRIKGATLSLPPLRARSDGLALAHEVLARLARERKLPCPVLSQEAVELIEAASWPGNVRELKTALHHALVLASGEGSGVLTPAHFPGDVIHSPSAPPPSAPGSAASQAMPASRALAERSAVERALLDAAGNLSDAARRLGVARTTLYRLMRRHGL